MFYDLPQNIQKSITQYLNRKDFVKAKQIYDAYNEESAQRNTEFSSSDQ